MKFSSLLAGAVCLIGFVCVFGGDPTHAIAQVWRPIVAASAPVDGGESPNKPDGAATGSDHPMENSQSTVTPAAKPSDVTSIDAIMAAVYDVISGPAGQKRDWDRMRSLFVPGAHLIAVTKDKDGVFVARMADVEEYINRASAYFEKEGFFEKESARRTETYGQIAQAFSTYESRHSASDPTPFERGINSFQLMNDGKRWWIVNIYWEGASEAGPIPEKYQKGKH